MYLLYNKKFNLAKFPLWNMFLCGVKDNDRNDDRFDSDELPAWLMLFSLLRTVFQGRKENFFEKEKKKKEKESSPIQSSAFALVSAGVNVDSLTSLLEFRHASVILEWVGV